MLRTRTSGANEIRIPGGIDIRLVGSPRQVLRKAGPVRSVAISGHDFPDVRPAFRVQAGDRVRAGQTIFVDRNRPDIAFTASASGTVVSIDRGHRRSLDAVVIRTEGDDAEHFVAEPSGASAIRALLLASGLWTSFLTRPFGRLPDPDSNAAAIFVTAIDTNPLAPDPMVLIGLHEEQFNRGLDALNRLLDETVFVCHAQGASFAKASDARVRYVAFSGRHPAGLPGTHVHHLAPVGMGRTVWTIGYQDVIAIGHLVSTGILVADRIISLAGSGIRDPALVRVRAGASLDDLLVGQVTDGTVRVLSGPVLSGREAGHLGRYHNQVTVLRENTIPVPGDFRTRWSNLLRGAPSGAIIPREAFERAMPLDILPVPLMRALSIGDVEAARDLGCLELVEEDMALLSHLCATGTDYGALLRDVLDELAGDG